MSKFELGDDVIDSRDVIERIEEVTSEIESLDAELKDLLEQDGATDATQFLEELEDLEEELTLLKSFEEVGAPDYQYGACFIKDEYFTSYVMEMLEDLGELKSDRPWYLEIDEDATAKNIQVDYMNVEVGIDTYWVRG